MNAKILAVTALAAGIALSPKAHANLIISVDGAQQSNVATNTFTNVTGSFGAFNISSTTVSGVALFGGSGQLIDVGSIDISTSGAGSLTVTATETNLTASGLASFTSTFTDLTTNATVARAFYADPTNGGLTTIALGSTTSNNGGSTAVENFTAPYSLTEVITVTATAAGAILSSDDSVRVPEPASLGLLGFSLLGIGMVARRRT